MFFMILWMLAALVGVIALLMGVRVILDDAWDAGDWWALDSPLLFSGRLFNLLFPVTRSKHDRQEEVLNAWIVTAVGALWFLGGLALTLREWINR